MSGDARSTPRNELTHNEQGTIRIKRVDMTDAEYDAMPEG